MLFPRQRRDSASTAVTMPADNEATTTTIRWEEGARRVGFTLRDDAGMQEKTCPCTSILEFAIPGLTSRDNYFQAGHLDHSTMIHAQVQQEALACAEGRRAPQTARPQEQRPRSPASTRHLPPAMGQMSPAGHNHHPTLSTQVPAPNIPLRHEERFWEAGKKCCCQDDVVLCGGLGYDWQDLKGSATHLTRGILILWEI